jgi:hypothetical protein
LSNYDAGCPHAGGPTSVAVYTTAALQQFVAFVALLGAAAGACWHCRRSRGGLVFRPPQPYKPLSTDELGGLSDHGEEWNYDAAPSGLKAGYTLANAAMPKDGRRTEPDSMEL